MTLNEILSTPGEVTNIVTTNLSTTSITTNTLNGMTVNDIIKVSKMKIVVDENGVIAYRGAGSLSANDYKTTKISTGLYEIELIGGASFPNSFYSQLTVHGLNANGHVFLLSPTTIRVKTSEFVTSTDSVESRIDTDLGFSLELDWYLTFYPRSVKIYKYLKIFRG